MSSGATTSMLTLKDTVSLQSIAFFRSKLETQFGCRCHFDVGYVRYDVSRIRVQHDYLQRRIGRMGPGQRTAHRWPQVVKF
jgi:hypothetical protein